MSNRPIEIKIDPSRRRLINEAVTELRRRGWCVMTYGDTLTSENALRRQLRSEPNEP